MISKLQKINLSDRTIKLLLYIMFATGAILCSLHLTIPVVLDEIGTMANTSYLAKDSWINCVQSMGGFYYKYGQSLFYYPLYMLFRDHPFRLYPAILVLQVLFLSLIPVISYHIIRTYFHMRSKIQALLISTVGAGISSVWLYSLYARGDFMMIFLPWIIILLFLKLSMMGKDTDCTKRNIVSVLLALTSVYAYMSHSRGIVIVIATILTIVLISIFSKKHLVNYFFFIPAAVIALLLDRILTRIFKAGTFGSYAPRHGSLQSFDTDSFMQLFTQKGISVYFRQVVGWMFNLCSSTFGLFFIGLLAVFLISLRMILKKSSLSLQENVIALFCFLLFTGIFFMGTLFFFPSAYKFMTQVQVNRADRFIYGRYTVSAVGPLCFMAVYYLIEKKDTVIGLKSKLFSLVFFACTIFAFTKWVGPYLNSIARTNSRYFISLTAFVNMKYGYTTTRFQHLDRSLLTVSLISFGIFVFFLAVSMAKNKKIRIWIAIITLAVSFINYDYVYLHVRKARNDLVYRNINSVVRMISEIDKKCHISQQYHCIYVANEKLYVAEGKSDIATNLKHYQLCLGRFDCSVLQYIQKTGQSQFFVIAKHGCEQETIQYLNQKAHNKDTNYYTIDQFNYKTTSGDVVLIKGAHLAQQIENAGYHLTPISYEH